MALMMGDLRAALIDGGANKALADKAATEVATYQGPLGRLKSDLLVIKWMLAFTLALQVAILLKLLAH